MCGLHSVHYGSRRFTFPRSETSPKAEIMRGGFKGGARPPEQHVVRGCIRAASPPGWRTGDKTKDLPWWSRACTGQEALSLCLLRKLYLFPKELEKLVYNSWQGKLKIRELCLSLTLLTAQGERLYGVSCVSIFSCHSHTCPTLNYTCASALPDRQIHLFSNSVNGYWMSMVCKRLCFMP